MLRKLFIATLIVCTILFSYDRLSANPLSAAKKRARDEGKGLVIYFFSEYCRYCIKMEKDVLSDKEIRDILKKELVYLKIDIDKDPGVTREQSIFGYPTTIFAEHNGKTIVKIPGYIPKKEFKKILFFLKEKLYREKSLGDFLRETKT